MASWMFRTFDTRETMNMSDYLETHYIPQKFLRQSTVVSYRAACRGLPGELPTISPAKILAYARGQLARGCAPHTVRGRVVVLCSVWRHAAVHGMAPAFEPVARPKCPAKIIRATPANRIGELVAHCLQLRGRLKGSEIPRATYWSAFAAASYESALRTSDLRQLRWREDGTWHLTQVKTGRPVTAAVSRRTLELIAKLADVSPQLFEMGWRREWYCRGIQRIARQIGLEITPQQLRQSAASEAERLRPGTAWRLLGHSNPQTCQKWYIDSAHAYADLPRPQIPWEK